MLDFGGLPPEVNSGLMYAGPGAGPLLAASAAWDALASELVLAATGYRSVIDELTSGPWSGPAALAMVAAATPYISWLNSTAAQAEELGEKARAAAAAYETAFAMTVPPEVVAANRATLMLLVATNFFGQNTASIMATEAHYATMWAQDATAMYSYAAAASTATTASSFRSPAPTTSGASAEQSAVAAKAASGSAEATMSVAQHTLTSGGATGTAQQVSTTAASSTTTSSSTLPWWEKLLPTPSTSWWGLTSSNYREIFRNMLQAYTTYGTLYQAVGMANNLVMPRAAGAAISAAPPLPAVSPLTGFTATPVVSAPAQLSASLGSADVVGKLSVPPSWGATAPEQTAQSAVKLVSAQVNEGAAESGLLRGMPLHAGGMQRRASGAVVNRYGFKYPMVPRPPAAG